VGELQRLSAENEPFIKDFLADIDRQFGTTSGTSFKEPEKIKEKSKRASIKRSKPWFEIEHIRDSFRFKTVLSNLEQLPQIAEKLRATGIEVVKTDTDKVLSPGMWGWRIAAFDLRMPNGQLVEYYCPVQELEAAKKDGNHALFEKWRNIDLKQLTQDQKLERITDINHSFEKYDTAWNRYLSRSRQTPERVREILDRTNKTLIKERIKGAKMPEEERKLKLVPLTPEHYANLKEEAAKVKNIDGYTKDSNYAQLAEYSNRLYHDESGKVLSAAEYIALESWMEKRAQDYLVEREKEDTKEGRDVVRALVLDIEVEVQYKEKIGYMKQIRDDKLTMSSAGAEKLDRWIEEKEKSRSVLREKLREVKEKPVEKERGGEDDLMR